MEKGKLIVIEGTDCSGKETQANLLLNTLIKEGVKSEKFSFPWYDSPTGKIIAGPYLEKPQYNVKGYFPEGATNVLPEIPILYYAADRKYNIEKITNLLDKGINVILDRYIESNLAHQASKTKNNEERDYIINFIEKLEYDLLKLPKADLVVFLHMPVEVSNILKRDREEKADQHEKDIEHLKKSEENYLYLTERYGFKKVKCFEGNLPRKKEDIAKDVYSIVSKYLKNE